MARNKRIKFIKLFILGLAIAFSVVYGAIHLFRYWDRQEAELMGIKYCWDTDGNHYLAPDPQCR